MAAKGTPIRAASAAQIDQIDQIDQIEQALGTLIRLARAPRFAELVQRRAGAEIDRAGYAVLVRIAELGPVRLSELSHQLGLDISTVSRQVQHLEQRGLVERHADPADGRAVQLELSAKGRATTLNLRQAWCDTVGGLLEGWKDTDVRRFAGLIDRFVVDLVKFLESET